MMKDICSVLVCSCDKYEDAWNPFFTLLDRYWDCPYPVFLNTETKEYNYVGHIRVNTLSLKHKKNEEWSKRLRRCLNQISSPYIIIMLEDFFLQSNVQQDIIDKCINYMESNETVGTICFECLGKKQNELPLFGLFVERKKGSKYRLNCQAAIWRKQTLYKCLRNFEDPWEFEEIGNLRSNGLDEKFYYQLKDTNPVFPYCNLYEVGYGLYRGKWLKSNIDLFKKENIHVDFEKLGFFDTVDQFVTYRRTWKEKIKHYIFHPVQIVKTMQAYVFKLYKNLYWKYERIKYKEYIH